MKRLRLLAPATLLFPFKISSLAVYIVLFLFALNLAGCATKEPIGPIAGPELAPTPQYENMKNEIMRLEKIIAEKDELIKNQKIRQLSQAHVLREANKEATRTQVKLHRLATKPSTASAIAEVEAALEHLKQTKNSSFDQILHTQAQRLLETATLFFSKEQYVAAMNHVSQANNFIALIADQNRKRVTHVDYSLLEFHMPMRLRTIKNAFLRKEPNQYAQVLSTLKKDTLLTANANQGPWLRVQTDKNQGWVLNTMLEIEENRNP